MEPAKDNRLRDPWTIKKTAKVRRLFDLSLQGLKEKTKP